MVFWDLNIEYPVNNKAQTVKEKLTPKDECKMEFADVDEIWKAYGTQQSVLRTIQPDYQLNPFTTKDTNSTTAAASTSSIAATSTMAAPASANPAHSFQQLSRIHLVIEEAGQLHGLNSTNKTLLSYDLVSVSSTNEKLFHTLCSHDSVDIVVLESTAKLPFYLKKPAINLAVERGIHFEFSYAPSIRGDGKNRRHLFSNILSLLRLTHGRNMILSSAAAREIELRGPWDVINLGALCGLSAATSKASITSHARSVLLHGEARKTMKCVLREVPLLQPTTHTETKAPMTKDDDQSESHQHKDKKMKLHHKKQ